MSGEWFMESRYGSHDSIALIQAKGDGDFTSGGRNNNEVHEFWIYLALVGRQINCGDRKRNQEEPGYDMTGSFAKVGKNSIRMRIGVLYGEL